jgi:hypothetical protein
MKTSERRPRSRGNPAHRSLTRVLKSYLDPTTTDFANAWVGIEPTFQTAKSVRRWKEMAVTPKGEEAYYHHKYIVKTQRRVAKAIRKEYRTQRKSGASHCLFERLETDHDLDQWDQPRQNLRFFWADERLAPLVVHFGVDPETFEYGIKPVPLQWFYDERFIAFLEEFLWKVPHRLGLSYSIAYGGGQFHLSAKTFLAGSLLADDIADRLNHPELASWIMDYPQQDDRAFRATRERRDAFRTIIEEYWEGRFHPRAIGILTPANAFLDRGFGPAHSAHKHLMDPRRGPVGTAREIFQTNFAFGRSVRLRGQNVHPGYWQWTHPKDEGYRADQVMRYSEGNLNRLEIAGELHVKSGEILDPSRVPEFDAPLDQAMLASQASWENRAQMTRTSARDFVEALLLEVHHAQYLQAHPHVPVKATLLQDQILGDAEHTLKRHGGSKVLARLRRHARTENLENSRGRIKSDWIEPEVLFWAAWKVLPAGEKAAIAAEAVGGFLQRVEKAAAMDRRPVPNDPMEWHRHRISPVLWEALATRPGRSAPRNVRRELELWGASKERYLARRPPWSPDKNAKPPWEA